MEGYAGLDVDFLVLSSLVAPPMASVNARPLRKWVEVRGCGPCFRVVDQRVGDFVDSAPLIPTAMMR